MKNNWQGIIAVPLRTQLGKDFFYMKIEATDKQRRIQIGGSDTQRHNKNTEEVMLIMWEDKKSDQKLTEWMKIKKNSF